MSKQVDRDAYGFGTYSGEDRWVSYHAQLAEILESKPRSVLEIGVGEGVIAGYLRANTDIEYTSVDVADDLNPDAIGDVRALPFETGSFDVVCAFEVLEHLPFDEFETAVDELFRVARKRVLISVPHFGPPVKLDLKLPLVHVRFAYKLPFPRTHAFNGQHYWELGKKGYPPRRVRRILESRGTLLKEFVPFGNQYHHFFVLEKNAANQ